MTRIYCSHVILSICKMLTIGNRTRILQTLLKRKLEISLPSSKNRTRDDIENILLFFLCLRDTIFSSKMHNALFPEQCNIKNTKKNNGHNLKIQFKFIKNVLMSIE